jgi:hypothetical protein
VLPAADSTTESPTSSDRLMESICDPDNLNSAMKKVIANGGAPGVDGMRVKELKKYFERHRDRIIGELLAGTYQPQPVQRVEIPKPDGGVRKLGIPTVVDRVIQQAILLVLSPQWDDTFSEQSFGFRPGRSAHDAVAQAQTYLEEGYTWVVDMDLEKFFDRVNHDVLMSRVARRVTDKRLLKLIRAFLNSGVMMDGLAEATPEGTPQGGPLAPPTKVQKSGCASFPRKKGEVDAVDDPDLIRFDDDTIDQGAEDLATRAPVGVVEICMDRVGEAVETRESFSQRRLLACLGLQDVPLRLQVQQTLSGALHAWLKLCPM